LGTTGSFDTSGDIKYNFESVGTAVGDLFEISGVISPTAYNTGVNIIDLRGAGPGLVSGTISSTVVPVSGGTADGGTIAVLKEGGGTWTLTKANTYTGPTTINSGTLALSGPGSISNSSVVVVKYGATLDVSTIDGALWSLGSSQTLKGNGTVAGNVAAPASTTVAPGESIGTLTVSGNATLGGTLDAEFDGSSSAADLLAVSGALNVSGALLNLTNLGAPSPVGIYVLATYGSLGGTFTTITGMPSGYGIDYHYAGANGGNSIALVVPEPATWMLMLLGVLAICGWRRLRNR
jgi:autotransporter-associated beta strand protein